MFILYTFINIFPDVCETSFKIKETIESKINLYKNGKATNIKEYLRYIPYAEGHNAFHQSKCVNISGFHFITSNLFLVISPKVLWIKKVAEGN